MWIAIQQIFTDFDLKIRENLVKIREIRSSINPTLIQSTHFVSDSKRAKIYRTFFTPIVPLFISDYKTFFLQ